MLSHRPGCVNARDNDKTTPLHQASIYGDADLCALLVSYNSEFPSSYCPYLRCSFQINPQCAVEVLNYFLKFI